MTTRRNRRVQARPRSYVSLVRAHNSNTSSARETIVRPNKGRRIRLIRARVVQESADGRRHYEVYFGTGSDIAADPSKAIDTLEVPELGEAATRTFAREEGPRGRRDEVLSGRWSGGAPARAHLLIIEYTEES